MLKTKLLFIFSLITSIMLGQSYNIYYEEIISFGIDRTLEELSNDLLKRRKKNEQSTSLLTFSNGNSTYGEHIRNFENGALAESIAVSQSTLYKSQTSKTFIKFFKLYKPSLYGEDIYIKDKLPEYKWEILKQKKVIAGYSCKLAKTIELDGSEIFAWYTDEIPINEGPRELWGLPGLILQAQINDRVLIVAVKIKKVDDQIEIDFPTNKKFITMKEFDALNHEIFRPRTFTTPDGATMTIGRP